MSAVFARRTIVNGVTYEPGDEVATSGLREDRYRQMVGLKRIIDSDDPNAAVILPQANRSPLLVADATGQVTGAVPVTVTPADVVESTEAESAVMVEGMDADGLWPCRVEGCDRRLGNERGRNNHEMQEHSS